MPKTEAQIRNEEEVRRIMEERGYSPASNKKKVRKTFGNNFPFKPFISGFLIIGFLITGGIILQNNPLNNNNNEQDSNSIGENTPSVSDRELEEFQACLGSIDTSEINLDDVEFWNKHISRYEQILSCYDNYPSVANPSKKAQIQNQLTELQNNSKAAEANETAYQEKIAQINAEYQASMAQIDAELEQNLAKIKEEGDAWDAELLRRVQERQAQREAIDADNKKKQDEYDAQQKAKKEAEEQAKQEKIARCATYVGKTKEELADNDSDVKNAKNIYNNASSAYNKAFNNYKAALNVSNQSLRNTRKAAMDEAKSTMDTAQSNYNNIRNSKLSYYSRILSSCN